MGAVFFDLHVHILPSFDDGPKKLEESLSMARAFASSGFAGVVATPHFVPGLYEPEPEEIEAKVSFLREALAREGVALEVYPGAEYRLSPEVVRLAEEGKVATIGGSKRYLLVELPFEGVPPFAEEALFALMLAGFTPVVAHPERCAGLAGNEGRLAAWVERGVLLQLTAGSLAGLFGPDVRRFSEVLLRRGLVHFVATDAHCAGKRLAAAREVAGLLGARGEVLLSSNPASAIKGLPVAGREGSLPEEQRPPSLLGRILGPR